MGWSRGGHLTADAVCSVSVQIWRFRNWVIAQLDPVMEELREMPAPHMAFHIRGGDKLSEDVALVR